MEILLVLRDYFEVQKFSLNEEDELKPRFKAELIKAQFGIFLHITDHKYNFFNIDISVQKILDIYNTKLIRTYALIDQRFVKVALVLKEWNKLNFKDKVMRLNSYSITLMLIAYMQHCKILPKL